MLAQNAASCQTKRNRGATAAGDLALSTVEKALDILDLLSKARPSVGLSEAARLLNRDKASTLRHLTALVNKGFLEQDQTSRAYYLGPALARYAMVRQTTFPAMDMARDILKKTVELTGETAHLSQFSGESLIQTAIEETSIRGTRVHVDPAEPLSLHGTASGLAYLSQCSEQRASALLARDLEAHTPDTPIDREEILRRVREVSQKGFAMSVGTFEAEVCGIAAPVFGMSGEVCGAIAVATPTSRMSDEARENIITAVRNAAQEISRHNGATVRNKESMLA